MTSSSNDIVGSFVNGSLRILASLRIPTNDLLVICFGDINVLR